MCNKSVIAKDTEIGEYHNYVHACFFGFQKKSPAGSKIKEGIVNRMFRSISSIVPMLLVKYQGVKPEMFSLALVLKL